MELRRWTRASVALSVARGNSRADPAQHGWRSKLILLDEMQVARKDLDRRLQRGDAVVMQN